MNRANNERNKNDRNRNVGIIGCGFISNSNIMAWQRLGHKVVAVCDLDEARAKKTASQVDAKAYTDFKEMLAEEWISSVSICTPPSSHYPIIKGVLDYDFVRVFVEKPFTLTSAQAKEFIDSDRIALFHTQLYSGFYYEALKLVKQGIIGKIIEVNVSTMTALDDYMTVDPENWSHRLKGGRIAECLPHPVYIAQAFTGQDDLQVKDARAYRTPIPSLPHLGFSELWAVLYGNDVRATLNVRMDMPFKNVATADIIGEKGCLKIGIIPKGIVGLTYLSKSSSYTERLKRRFFGSPFSTSLKMDRRLPRVKIISEFMEGKCPMNAKHGYYNMRAVEEIVEKIL